jgi:hypothetical protein
LVPDTVQLEMVNQRWTLSARAIAAVTALHQLIAPTHLHAGG